MLCLLTCFGLSNISLANKIDYFSLKEYKRYFFDEYNKYRYSTVENNILESFNILKVSNEKKQGEIFLDVLENDVKSWNMEYVFYVKKNSINNFLSIYRTDILNEVLVDYGFKLKHSKYMYLNEVDLGLVLKSKINEYYLNLNAVHNFSYNFFDFKKYNIKKEMYNINGAVNLEANIGNNFKILPSINLAYIYDFSHDFIDQNKSLIKVKKGFDISLGAGIKLEYEYIKDFKLKIGSSYIFSKIIFKKDKYEIFKKNLVNDISQNQIHMVSIYLNANIKDIHNIKAILSYNKSPILTLSYGINW
ncbi:hypothetical protein OMES3154_00611 [Oceanivirga miroungae]|uniref:Uncharacterized protein n=1 Tax=Oceanivirga miroungae TaxID=1130046 RepID=A0A6I8M746_9FUSO|nr:hypothetical protein OMES3154_00611 [Oceanivirga miroungae]